MLNVTWELGQVVFVGLQSLGFLAADSLAALGKHFTSATLSAFRSENTAAHFPAYEAVLKATQPESGQVTCLLFPAVPVQITTFVLLLFL